MQDNLRIAIVTININSAHSTSRSIVPRRRGIVADERYNNISVPSLIYDILHVVPIRVSDTAAATAVFVFGLVENYWPSIRDLSLRHGSSGIGDIAKAKL